MTIAVMDTGGSTPNSGASAEEVRLVAALRAGDETAFVVLIDRHNPAMLRLARYFVRDPAVAEEVVQETWVAVLQSLPRFAGRSSLKTWIFRILTNRAKTRGKREGRTVPFSALARDETRDDDPAVDPARFQTAEGRWPGHWAVGPQPWSDIPEERILSQETGLYLKRAIATLPPAQQEILRLRDIEGWSSAEVCNVLAISESNQRVLLHRARSKVRRALAQYLTGE